MEKGILRAVVACGLLFGAINVSAFDKVEAAPFVKGEINGNYTETDWMKHIPGSTYVCHVTIPGTHDTATGEGFVSETAASRSQTQNKTIVEQINAGIRGLDFRPNLKKGVLKCCHGADETNKPFAEAIDELKAFLEAHPSEFFVIHLLKAGSSADYKAAIYDFFNQEQYAGLFVNFRRDLTVDDLRGKILIFNRNEDFPVPFGGDLIWWHEQGFNTGNNSFEDAFIRSYHQAGEGYAKLYTQDVAHTYKEADQNAKIYQLNKLAEYSTSTYPFHADECEWFFNFASAYTDWLISSSKGYADNASFTNPTFINLVRDNSRKGNLGIVLFDWACDEIAHDEYATMGQSIINALIENNFRYIDWVEDGCGEAYSRPMLPMYANLGDEPTWQPACDNSVFLAKERCQAIMADFDNNDWLDIYNVGDLSQSHLYLNQGGGKEWTRFADANGQTVKSDIVPLNYPHLATLDYNNDGLVDILAMGIAKPDDLSKYGSNNCKKIKGTNDYTALLLFKNLGEGRFALEANFDIPTYYTRFGDKNGFSSVMHPIAVGDFDRDGFADIAISGLRIDADGADGIQESALYRNLGGTGSFEKFDGDFKKTGGSAYMADFNNDGFLDLLFTGWGEGEMFGNTNGCLYRNQGGVSFAEVKADNLYFTRHGADGIADFNNDGYLDLLSMGWSDYRWGYKSFLFMNNHTDVPFDYYEDINNYCGRASAGEQFNIFLGDFNGDGHIDIMYDGQRDDSIDLGTSPTSFQGKYTPFPVRGHTGGQNACIALGDVTGSGLVDRFQSGWNWVREDYRQQLFGSDSDWQWDHTLWLNTDGKTIDAPKAPANATAVFADGILTINWEDVDDNSLAYNVIVTNEDEGKVIANIPVNPATGKLRVPMGKETCVRPGVQTYSIPVGEGTNINGYKAGVQAVSLVNATASAITPAAIDDMSGINIPVDTNRNFKVETNGMSVIVIAGNESSVEIFDVAGRKVAEGVTNAPINVAKTGVYIVSSGNNNAKISIR